MGPTIQASHNDYFAGDNQISGAVQLDTGKDKSSSHSIATFTISDILQLPAGSYKVVDGKIVPDN